MVSRRVSVTINVRRAAHCCPLVRARTMRMGAWHIFTLMTVVFGAASGGLGGGRVLASDLALNDATVHLRAIVRPHEPSLVAVLQSIADDYHAQIDNNTIVTFEPAGKFASFGSVTNYVQRIAGELDQTYDIYGVETTWAPTMRNALDDLYQYPALKAEISNHFSHIVQSFELDGQLLAMPWSVDYGVLFYNKQLLNKYNFYVPPTTWEELIVQAMAVMEGEYQEVCLGGVGTGPGRNGTADCVTPVNGLGAGFSGSIIVPLLLEVLYAHDAGTIVELDGTISIDSPGAIEATRMLQQMVLDIVKPDTMHLATKDRRAQFYAGRTLFMREWARNIPEITRSGLGAMVGVTALPGIASTPAPRRAGTVSGVQLGINSQVPAMNKARAAAFVLHLSSAPVQLRLALETQGPGTLLPSRPRLFSDVSLCEATVPLCSVAPRLTARPISQLGDHYLRLQAVVASEYEALVYAQATPEAVVSNVRYLTEVALGRSTDGPGDGGGSSDDTARTLAIVLPFVGVALVMLIVGAIYARHKVRKLHEFHEELLYLPAQSDLDSPFTKVIAMLREMKTRSPKPAEIDQITAMLLSSTLFTPSAMSYATASPQLLSDLDDAGDAPLSARAGTNYRSAEVGRYLARMMTTYGSSEEAPFKRRNRRRTNTLGGRDGYDGHHGRGNGDGRSGRSGTGEDRGGGGMDIARYFSRKISRRSSQGSGTGAGADAAAKGRSEHITVTLQHDGSGGALSSSPVGAGSVGSEDLKVGSTMLANAWACAGFTSNVAEVKELLEGASAWDFDVFELERRSNGQPLFCMVMHTFEEFGLMHRMGLHPSVVASWALELESLYRTDVAYHNSVHAADVVHATAFMLRHFNQETTLYSDVLFSGLVAAAAHDVGHPARTNSFLINTRDPLSTLYSDQSVLEMHHLAVMFDMTLSSPARNIFATFSRDRYKDIRSNIVSTILATDMAKHFEQVERLKNVLGHVTAGTDSCPLLADLDMPSNVHMLLNMCVKTGDVSNCAKPMRLYQNWISRIMTEFFNQGDAEVQANLPVSLFMNRTDDPCHVPKCQVGFISFIVRPLFTVSFPQLGDKGRAALHQLENNLVFFQRQVEALTKQADGGSVAAGEQSRRSSVYSAASSGRASRDALPLAASVSVGRSATGKSGSVATSEGNSDLLDVPSGGVQPGGRRASITSDGGYSGIPLARHALASIMSDESPGPAGDSDGDDMEMVERGNGGSRSGSLPRPCSGGLESAC